MCEICVTSLYELVWMYGWSDHSGVYPYCCINQRHILYTKCFNPLGSVLICSSRELLLKIRIRSDKIWPKSSITVKGVWTGALWFLSGGVSWMDFETISGALGFGLRGNVKRPDCWYNWIGYRGDFVTIQFFFCNKMHPMCHNLLEIILDTAILPK